MPINVVVGALFLKDIRQQSDDDILESILFDVRYQYALHTTSMAEQPISDRALGRFCVRCYEYELKTGIDLIMEENKALAADMAVMMKIDGTLKRMDSMMVASSIKNLSRLELLYTCLANLINEMNDRKAALPENLIHYTDEDDRNQFIYHNKSDDTEEKITKVLTDCSTVLLLCDESYAESSNYLLFRRVLSEQTVCENGIYRLSTRKDGGTNGGMLQNLADPDATYREKAGQGYKGYSANFVESIGDGCSLITDYAFQPNTHSDSGFAKETIEGMGKQEQKTTIVADGACKSKQHRPCNYQPPGAPLRISRQTSSSAMTERTSSDAPADMNRRAVGITRKPDSALYPSKKSSAKNARISINVIPKREDAPVKRLFPQRERPGHFR